MIKPAVSSLTAAAVHGGADHTASHHDPTCCPAGDRFPLAERSNGLSSSCWVTTHPPAVSNSMLSTGGAIWRGTAQAVPSATRHSPPRHPGQRAPREPPSARNPLTLCRQECHSCRQGSPAAIVEGTRPDRTISKPGPSGGDTILIGIGHGASPCRSFWTISSSVTPPKKSLESITENPLSRKISRK